MVGPNEKGKQKPVTVHLSSMYSYFIMKIINNKIINKIIITTTIIKVVFKQSVLSL